jgi:ADP-ribosyl-[dinitrogen reductase] hydrolase
MKAPERDIHLPGGYWAEPGRLYAGEYPGHRDPARATDRIAALLDAGIDYFVDLTWPDELPSYSALLPSPYEAGPGRAVTYSRRPIRDHSVPADPVQMIEILDEIDDAVGDGHCVYVHCRAGIGRTGTVVGCWLARRLGGGSAALAALENLWNNAGRDDYYPRTPETDEQIAYVRLWREAGVTSGAATPGDALGASTPRDALGASTSRGTTPRVDAARVATAPAPPPESYAARVHGLVCGIAVGDALGMPVEGRRAGEFPPVLGYTAGGPYELPAGAWTDDTAMALLLAESLTERGANDARDQIHRYTRWQREGHLTSTGRCVGIGATTTRALAQAQWSGNPYSGSHDPAKAEKDPLTRAAIAAAWSIADPEAAIALAAEVARTTHQAPAALDACRYYAALITGALLGAPREQLLAPNYSPVPGLWERKPLRREIAAVAAGGWRKRTAPAADGTAVHALQLALWSLERGPTWRDATIAAIQLGHETAASGAIVGGLAGALYGVGGIPAAWRSALAGAERIAQLADALARSAEPRGG